MSSKEQDAAGEQRSAKGLTHVDERGRASMVDVGDKPLTARRAVAEAVIQLDPETCDLLFAGALPKGEALAVARVAGVQAAKEASRLIPLCHTLALSHVEVRFARDGGERVRVEVEASTVAGTGVEMEAMTGAGVAALTIYDMTKARCRGAVIERLQLLHKSGGKSGTYDRAEES